MNLADIATLAFGSLGTGVWIGFSLKRTTNPPTVADMQRYMHQVVNVEQIEDGYNRRRKMLHDAKRRTMPRGDSGRPARVSRMRIRRRVPRRVLEDSSRKP